MMSKSRMKNLFKFRSKSTADLSEWNKNDEKLLKAVESGDIKKVHAVLTKKTLIPTKLGPRGHNVFHVASAVGNEQIVEILLKYCDDVNVRTLQGTTALQLAAAKGHTNIVKRLLQTNADVDMIDSNNMTALHHSCAGLHLECVQELLAGNACPQIKEKTGKTPLFYAAHRGNLTICKRLVDKRADVNASDMYQITPLIVAAKEGQKEVVEFLLKKGAIPDHMDREGHSALMYAMAAGHHSMKEVFAKAPTRASWDVHASNKINTMPVQETPVTLSQPESAPVDQDDMVDTFNNDSPSLNHKDIQQEDGVTKTSSQSNCVHSAENHLVPEAEMANSVKASASELKTRQALKELEEEHEQLNEEFHKLSLEKMKLQDKVDFMGKRMEDMKQRQTKEVNVPQEVEDELRNVKNLLEEEQERSRELAIRLHLNPEEGTVLSTSMRAKIKDDDVECEATTGDSWGDSDEELFDSTKKQRIKDDSQMVALLRGQILAVNQENDQLKEKLQSLPNGLREASPYIFQSDKETVSSSTNDTEELQVLQLKISSLETENEDLKSQVLKAKESSQMELLTGAINHEELVVQNQTLTEQLEEMKSKLEDSLAVEHVVHERSSSVDGDSGDSGISGVKPESSKTTNVTFLQAQNEQLTDQCSLLTDELEKLRTTFDAILKAGDNLQTDYDVLQNDKEKLQEEYERTVQEKEELVKENEFLLSDGNALHEDLKKLVHELEKMQEKLKKVQKEKDDTVRASTAVSLSGKVGEFTKLLEERDGLKQQLEELTEEWTRLQHDQEILVEEVQSLQEQVTTLSTERDKLQTDTDDFETLLQTYDVLQQDYSQLEQDYAELLKEKEKVEQELLDGQTSSVALQRTASDPEDLTRDDKDLVRENKNLGYEKEQLEMTVNELSKTNALLEEELGQLQQELEHTQGQLEHTHDQLEQTQGQLEHQGHSDVDLTLQSAILAEKEQQMQHLQEELSILQMQLADFDERHKNVVDTYRTHLISAVQGHMDSSLKEALHQIIELRSMEQFC